MKRSELNAALLKAHAQRTTGGGEENTQQLAELYYQAYELMIEEDPNAGYFYLSNAYVYALESDHNNTGHIKKLLTKAGRL